MECTHNAKKTGVHCQLSVQLFFLLPFRVKSQSCVLGIVCHQWHDNEIQKDTQKPPLNNVMGSRKSHQTRFNVFAFAL